MKYILESIVEHAKRSPSVWREWIEMKVVNVNLSLKRSPSVWREWIEILKLFKALLFTRVSLRVEGVD